MRGGRRLKQPLLECLSKTGFESPRERLEGAKEEWALINRDEGQGLAITLFETEDELGRGHEALDARSPPDEASSSRRTEVALYEVALQIEKG